MTYFEVVGSVTCLTDNGGMITAKVKITNKCGRTAEFVLAVRHEAGPNDKIDTGWDVVYQQEFEAVALRSGASKDIVITSPEHPEKAYYRLIANISEPNSEEAKELSLGGTLKVCYPVDPAVAEFVPPTQTPLPTPTRDRRASTPTIVPNGYAPTPQPTDMAGAGGTTSDDSSNSLLGATMESLLPFFAPFLLGGFLVVLDQVMSYRRDLKRRDHRRIWWAWLVVMVSGGIALAVAVLAGLVAAAIVEVVAELTAKNSIGSTALEQAAIPIYLAFLGAMLVAGAIAGGLAGLIQWVILRNVKSEKLGAWVGYNVICWPIALVTSFVLPVIIAYIGAKLGTNAGAFVVYGVIVAVGAVAGCIISHKSLQPTLALSLWGRDDS